MSTANNGGPAFPTENERQTGANSYHYEGMTLRDYFAGKALAGMLAGLDRDARRFMERQQEPADAMAKACFVMADAMLKARL